MKILITGGTGFVGSHLIPLLEKQGHDLVLLTRNPDKARQNIGEQHEYFQWDALSGPAPAAALKDVEGVINLMGEGVAEKRWTTKQKQKIHDTRVIGTRNLVQALNSYDSQKLKVMVSGSAIGFYHDKSFDAVHEGSPKGKGFMPDLCEAWENEAKAVPDHVRLVTIRIGVVLGNDGALKKMLPIFKMGLGGPLGHGQQWMNWIHVHDLASLFVKGLEDISMTGTYNGVAPENATNKDFSTALGQVVNRPAFMPAPAFAIRLAVGEMADILLEGQKVLPRRTLEAGFKFQFNDLHKALLDACQMQTSSRTKKKSYAKSFS